MKTASRISIFSCTVAIIFCSASFLLMQAAKSAGAAQDQSRAVADGGVSAPGWTGQIDSQEASRGMVLANGKLVQEGDNLHVTTGPATSYWNPKNTASGNYTVKATFTEPKYMNLNSHPHPYGVFIGGNDMGTPQETLLYCSAYGNGTFIVRGFGPQAFPLNGRGEAADSVHKAAAVGSPVTQDIALSVTPDAVTCTINGKQVASYPKSQVVGEGKLKSTDGVYGIRFSHNTEGIVSGLTVTKP